MSVTPLFTATQGHPRIGRFVAWRDLDDKKRVGLLAGILDGQENIAVVEVAAGVFTLTALDHVADCVDILPLAKRPGGVTADSVSRGGGGRQGPDVALASASGSAHAT